MSSYNTQDNSTQEEKNQPSYFAVIPAEVRYCKDIESSAKLFYGELSALSNLEGYCWAKNDYFSELYGVDDRTIRRWIQSLQENNFIFVEWENKSFNPKRKIYINNQIQKSFTVGQKCPGRTKMSGGSDKNVQPLNIYNTTTNIVAAAPEKGGSENQFSKDDLYAMANRLRKDWTSQEIENSWTIFQKKTYPVTDPFAFVEGIIKKTRTLKNHKETKKCQEKLEVHLDSKEKSEIVRDNYSENVTLVPALAHFAALYSPKKPLVNLCKNPETSLSTAEALG